MANKEKIKQEIERRIKNLKFSLENNCVEKHSKLDILGNITTLESLLQFINSIPEEHNEDLENAAIAYSCSNRSERSNGMYDQTDIEWAFEAGAEWQKQKDQETIELAEDHAMLAGMNKMKEEMMENAVDAEVFVDYNINFGYGSLTANIDLDEQHLKEGDKVKIIIVKEE